LRSRPTLATVATALASASLLGLTAQPAAAATTPVTRSVNPGDNVAKAVADAQPGDTVVLNAGTYKNLLFKELAKSNVTVRGVNRTDVNVQGLQILNSSGINVSGMAVDSSPDYKSSAVRIQGSSHDVRLQELTVRQTYAKGVAITDQSHHIVVDKLDLDGSLINNTTGRGIYIEGAGASTNWPHDITLSRNEIYNQYMDAIFITGARNVAVDGNYLHHLKPNPEHNDGVQVIAGIGVQITRNVLTSPGDTTEPDQGIILTVDLNNPNAVIADTYIANNVIRDWRGSGIIVAGASNTQIVNNTIARTGAPSYRAASVLSTEGTRVTNSGLTVWNNVIESVNRDKGTIAYEDYNCILKAGTGAHDVTTDPQFADNGKLDLATTSPCVGTGLVRAGNPTVDINGVARAATAVTMGAYA
jgi:hypothetical protein